VLELKRDIDDSMTFLIVVLDSKTIILFPIV